MRYKSHFCKRKDIQYYLRQPHRTCMENNSTDDCLHNDDEKALMGTWVTEEIKINLLIRDTRWRKSTKSGTLIRSLSTTILPKVVEYLDYVNTFLKIKQEASGWPKWCKTQEDWELSLKDYYKIEGIWLDAARIEYNLGWRHLAKLILNRYIKIKIFDMNFHTKHTHNYCVNI